MADNAKRDPIFPLKTAGVTNKEILKSFWESDTFSSKLIPGITRSVRTQTISSDTKKKLERNRQGNVGKVAKHSKTSRSTMRRVIVDDP